MGLHGSQSLCTSMGVRHKAKDTFFIEFGAQDNTHVLIAVCAMLNDGDDDMLMSTVCQHEAWNNC